MSFKARYPNMLCSLTSFESMKPWWVRHLRLWNTCYCKYHQELLELLRALDTMCGSTNKQIRGRKH